MKAILYSTLSLSITFLPSCASIGARSRNTPTGPYSGVKENLYYLSSPSEADQPLLQPLNLIDLPLSAVADTILLPFDLAKNMTSGHKKSGISKRDTGLQ